MFRIVFIYLVLAYCAIANSEELYCDDGFFDDEEMLVMNQDASATSKRYFTFYLPRYLYFFILSQGIYLPTSKSLRFVLLGDWGKGANVGDITGEAQKTSSWSLLGGRDSSEKVYYTYQAAISKLMATLASKVKISGIFALGDNFYSNGVISIYDAMWSTNWAQVYFERFSNLAAVPWYAVLGNHDFGYGFSGIGCHNFNPNLSILQR